MGLFPERSPSVDQIVEKRPEEIKVPETLTQTGVEAVETAFKANVQQDGQQLTQAPQTQAVTIQIPGNQTNLTAWSKGNIVDSVTWLALFWLRQLKKAMHFGWRVVWGTNNAGR